MPRDAREYPIAGVLMVIEIVLWLLNRLVGRFGRRAWG